MNSQHSSLPASLPEQLKTLEHVQELDLKIDHLKKNKSSLPETLRSIDASIAKIQATLTTKTNLVAEMEKAQRQTRAALDLNRDRFTRSSTRLESVQNSQEFQAVNKEVEQIKKLNANLEEQTKKAEGEIEAIQKEITDLNAQIDKLNGERAAQASLLEGQSSQIEGELKGLLDNRAQLVAQVDRQLMSQYDRVRGARGGLGFVPAVAGRCKGCNMMVPPQLFNEIRKATAIHSCPSCYRILFVPISS